MEYIEVILEMISPIFKAQVMQFTLAFALAAWIHSGRVKREIKNSFSGLSEAIKELGEALREDLKSHAKRIENVEFGVEDIKSRVSKLEGGENGSRN